MYYPSLLPTLPTSSKISTLALRQQLCQSSPSPPLMPRADAVTIESQAKAAFGAARYDEAARMFGQLVEMEPHSHIHLSNRSAALLRQNHPEAAARDARRAILLSPAGSIKAHYRLVCALQSSCEWSAAIEVVETALLIQPGHPQLERARAQCVRELSKPILRISKGKGVRVICERPRAAEALSSTGQSTACTMDEKELRGPRMLPLRCAAAAGFICLAMASPWHDPLKKCARFLLGMLLSASTLYWGPRRLMLARKHDHAAPTSVSEICCGVFEQTCPTSLLTLPSELSLHVLSLLTTADVLAVRSVSRWGAELARRHFTSAAQLFRGTFSFSSQRLHLMSANDMSVGTVTLRQDGSLDGQVQEGNAAIVRLRGCWEPNGKVILVWNLGQGCLIHEIRVVRAHICLSRQHWMLTGHWRTASFDTARMLNSIAREESGRKIDHWHDVISHEDSEHCELGCVPCFELVLLYED